MVDRCAVIDLPPESQDDETNTNRSFLRASSLLSDFALFRVYCLSQSDADTAEAALVAGLDRTCRAEAEVNLKVLLIM